MTTTYHTPYPFGGALTAAAMTAPLGQLDEAIGYAYQGVNVKDYGAVGADGTDDDSAINSAITAVNSAGGGIVFIPEGTYRCAAAIVLRSNVILRGEGYGTVLKLKATTVADVVKSAATSAASSITFAGVEYLRIDGNKANQTANNDAQQYGISLNGANDCWVDHVWVHDTKRSGIYLAGERNRATNNRLWSIGALGAASSIIGRSGIVFGEIETVDPIRSVAYGNTIVDCLEHGIKIYPGGHNSTMSGNIILAAQDRGIYIAGANNCAVTGNNVAGASVCGILIGDTSAAATGNSVTGNTVSGILVGTSGGHGILVWPDTRTVVSGNVVTGCYGHGIYVLNGLATAVTGNVCHGNGTGGGGSGIVFYQSPDGSITGNVCSNNGTTGSRGRGIWLWDAGTANVDIAIVGNRCYDTGAGAAKVQAYGIESLNASNYLTVSANALRGNYTATHALVGANNVYTAGAV